jgi:hypothetical protein
MRILGTPTSPYAIQEKVKTKLRLKSVNKTALSLAEEARSVSYTPRQSTKTFLRNRLAASNAENGFPPLKG